VNFVRNSETAFAAAIARSREGHSDIMESLCRGNYDDVHAEFGVRLGGLEILKPVWMSFCFLQLLLEEGTLLLFLCFGFKRDRPVS
jgi:hypothetical protein